MLPWRHYLECPPQQLRKHIEKLQQSDPRLNELLSKEEDIMLILQNLDPESLNLTSRMRTRIRRFLCYEYTPPVEDVKKVGIERPKDLITLDQIRAMSMTDLLSYLEERVSGQDLIEAISMTDDIVTNKIRRQLLTDDTDDSPAPDDKALMSYVNSLSSLLQQDKNKQSKNDDDGESSSFGGSEGGKESDADICGFNKLWAMSKKDSFGVSLLNLPRMASLPQFLFKISEDFESES
ncbi:hypothetical protein BUALT_Bualt02G0192400 [Buddleja alternifolia]|uniref:Uncharacterized protein n=1 Tax=Buddleja alternifolia TaxID=168488 RepID=A0AAV6Y2Q6_9LAMI|nr:hypothetical protein BUALT_Bualt02G0192400 [Buddleja alternifolia]